MWPWGTQHTIARTASGALGVTVAALCLLTVALPSTDAGASPGSGTASTTTLGPGPSRTTSVPTPGTTVPSSTPTLGSLTTTTVVQHVVNQPNLNALVPHIEALRGAGVQYQQSSGVVSQAGVAGVPSFLSAPGGPYLYDRQHRMVLFHGVNVVYKHAPYIAYPDPGRPWDFGAHDAQALRDLGFNVVRLGIEWQALEPGSGGPNQPGICTAGTPAPPHEFNPAVAARYLRHVKATVDLLARYGISTLLDMHQDVYNRNFRGEGAPDWAVCTDGAPIVPSGGRWSDNYANPELQTAVQHFWSNDVVGNLQGNFDLAWAAVARTFENDPWVIGYDPYNEPFSTATQTAASSTYTGQLECFYTGKDHTGFLASGLDSLVCPANVPDNGVVPTIEAIDHHHLIFVEPDIYWVNGGNIPSQLGPMPFPRLVFNFHVYCGDRSPVTGNPTNLLQCLESEETTANEQDVTRLSMSSADQPTGPAIFMSEFGASTSVQLVGFDAEAAGLDELGWAYWAWKYYDDPTGSSAEGLVLPDGSYSPVVSVLARTYPQQVAGDPNSIQFNPFSGAFTMVYAPTLAARGVTTVDVAAAEHYPNGWCAAVRGGRITSASGATHLTIETVGRPSQVYVTVTAGACPG